MITPEIQLYIDNAVRNAISTHEHIGSDSKKLNPKNFLGFPVFIVADASVAPTFTNIKNGQFIIQTDNKSGTPHWYLWFFIINTNTNVAGWHYQQIT